MSRFRLCFLAATLGLSSCSTPTAPEPAEFKLSPAGIRQQFPATRTVGVVELFAKEIETTRDEQGVETHLATGGALLIKQAIDPIWAHAPSILVTPDFAEVRGKATVKKDQQLYIGKEDSTKFIIEKSDIIPTGPHAIRAIASVVNAPATTEPENLTPPVQEPSAEVATKPEPPQPLPKPARKAVSKPAAKPKPAPPPDKPKSLPADERAKLLNLMRAPKDPT
ncbi:hypothetical protein [Prosthecobacter sp.]|uniref:hypothetical protein n=1 Tax=Prosthecobacter sp. TaxID=1965333 RepID=UPI002ABBE564|nr:hypothetical protein [Prosthecobacter sp.]MDZ4403721.1 hypothetical protein [Prosthecobacter sp.]